MLREKYIPIILQINVVNLCFTIRRAQFFPLAEWSFFRNYLPIKLHPLGKNTSALIQCTPPFKIDAWNCIMSGMRETPSQFMSPNIHFDLQSKKNWWYGSQNAIFFTIKWILSWKQISHLWRVIYHKRSFESKLWKALVMYYIFQIQTLIKI